MTWKCWKWPRHLRMHYRLVHDLTEAYARESATTQQLERVLAFRRTPHPSDDKENSISHALMFVDDNDAQWLAIHRLIDIMDSEEQVLALRPSMDSDERAYNNGRAAAVADVRAMLLQQWAKARVAAREQR